MLLKWSLGTAKTSKQTLYIDSAKANRLQMCKMIPHRCDEICCWSLPSSAVSSCPSLNPLIRTLWSSSFFPKIIRFSSSSSHSYYLHVKSIVMMINVSDLMWVSCRRENLLTDPTEPPSENSRPAHALEMMDRLNTTQTLKTTQTHQSGNQSINQYINQPISRLHIYPHVYKIFCHTEYNFY